MTSYKDYVEGCVYGSAFGDAWGFVTEFKHYAKIIANQPSPPSPLVVSDDTQMSVYTILAAEEILTENNLQNLYYDSSLQNKIRKIFADYFVGFYHDKDNNRAPGNTVMTSLAAYQMSDEKISGREGCIGNNSKGCGTIMRSPWLGLLREVSAENIFILSILQSQVTHDHPISWLSAGLLSLLIRDITQLDGNVDYSRKPCFVVHSYKLLNEVRSLWVGLGYDETYVDEMVQNLDKITETWEEFTNSTGDVSSFYGAGWTADTAYYTSVATASLYPDNPHKVVERLVYTSGDSDSLACIGGAIVGALNGYEDFNYPIKPNLEKRYQRELSDAVKFLSR